MIDEYREKVVVRDPLGPGLILGRVVYFVLDVVEIMLAIRLLLRAFVLNGSAFSNFIFSVTAPLVAPFSGLFAPSSAAGLMIEWPTVIAMIVYLILAVLVIRLLRILLP